MRCLCSFLILAFSAAFFAVPFGATAAGADRWTFPDPFSMDSPESPHRNGGIEFRAMVMDGGWALAFPLRSNMTTESGTFIAQAFLPLLVTVPDGYSTGFTFGDPRVGVRGSWRLEFPLAEGKSIPMALSGGLDMNIPFSAFWGDMLKAVGELAETSVSTSASAVGISMYTENPLGWISGFWGFNPRFCVALGEPLFFFEADTTFIMMFPIQWRSAFETEIWFNWAAAFGSQPHDTIALIAEVNGTVDLTGSGSFLNLLPQNLVFAGAGVRFYYQGFTAGLMARFPLTDLWKTAETAPVIFSIYIGGELKRPK
jgi:hypothetical protein